MPGCHRSRTPPRGSSGADNPGREHRLTERINARLATLNTDDVKALAQAGAEIRSWVSEAAFPPDLEKAIREHFARLTKDSPAGVSFAVRSSATAEDLSDASFAGQQKTILNIVGIDAILDRIREVFASLYNDRAISYRVHKVIEIGRASCRERV